MALRLRGEGGFTLVEMICVCLLLGVVIAGVTTVFVGGSKAELNLNSRFKAQQVARSTLDTMRNDVHNACAANVANAGALLKLAFVPSGDPTQCGAASGNTIILWCATASPTLPSQYALYRSTTSTCDNTKTLMADRVTTNVIWTYSTSIPVSQLQTITVTLPVTYQQGTYGAPFTLGQTLVLRNTVYNTTNATTPCPATAQNATCAWGICPFNGPACYVPVIQ
jgi:prepilin-type N-terminal cleavage/methylation domain-containing protein